MVSWPIVLILDSEDEPRRLGGDGEQCHKLWRGWFIPRAGANHAGIFRSASRPVALVVRRSLDDDGERCYG